MEENYWFMAIIEGTLLVLIFLVIAFASRTSTSHSQKLAINELRRELKRVEDESTEKSMKLGHIRLILDEESPRKDASGAAP